MAHDLLYSSDKQRLLEELAEAASDADHHQRDRLMSSQNVDELHELFGKVVGLPAEEEYEPAAPEKGPRMTHQQLNSMKHVSLKVTDPTISMRQNTLKALHHIWCIIKGWFRVKEG